MSVPAVCGIVSIAHMNIPAFPVFTFQNKTLTPHFRLIFILCKIKLVNSNKKKKKKLKQSICFNSRGRSCDMIKSSGTATKLHNGNLNGDKWAFLILKKEIHRNQLYHFKCFYDQSYKLIVKHFWIILIQIFSHKQSIFWCFLSNIITFLNLKFNC